jgi:hypothetical protein
MSDFDDIIEQYEQIKDTPDVLSKTEEEDAYEQVERNMERE